MSRYVLKSLYEVCFPRVYYPGIASHITSELRLETWADTTERVYIEVIT